MRKKRAKRVARKHHDFAQILNKPNEGSSQRVKESNEHLLLCLDTERLRFCFWPQFCRNRAHESRIERELAKGDRGLVELEINQVVIAIDLVTQAGNGRELMIELQNFVQIAKICGVNF